MTKGALKETKKFNWWVVPTILCVFIAIIAIVAYLITLNMALVGIILPAIGGAGIGIYKLSGPSLTAKGEGISTFGPVKGDVNAFRIYCKRTAEGQLLADKVDFEYLDAKDLLGDRWFFEDLNRWLHVMYNAVEEEGSTWRAFELPDAAYTDPARLSIQLNMSRTNELFQLDPTLFDQLKPWIMLAAISVIGFLIFLSGGG